MCVNAINNKFSFVMNKSINISHKQFVEKLDNTERIQLSQNVSHSMRFALYRANLYNLGFGKSVSEDLQVYTQYVKTIELTHLLISSIHSLNSFCIQFKDSTTETRYKDVKNNCHFVIYNTFHFGAFISLVDYLAFHNDEVYVLASEWMIEKPLEHNDYKVRSFKKNNKSKVIVKFINSGDISCLLQMKEIKELSKINSKKIAAVTLIDGLVLENSSEKSNNYFSFFRGKVVIQQHITTFAERLKIPLIHCYMTSNNQKLELNIRDVFDFPKSTQTSTEVLSKICSDFEQILKGNNIGLWTLIADLHVSIQNTERLSQTKYVEETNYEENRFTEVYLGHDLFLYDSKYGIAYQACKYKKLKNKKEKVISAHIIL